MLTLLVVILVIAAAVGAYVTFRGNKLASRVGFKLSGVEDNIADKVGNIVDDRKIKIKQGKTTLEDITEGLVKVITEINVQGERVEKFVAEAAKMTNIAKKAKEDGNIPAAMEALKNATTAEESAKAFKITLEGLEAERDRLEQQRSKLSSNIENAEANTAIYEARFSAAQLQKKMTMSDAFGGVDNLNFDDSDEALSRLEAENSARAQITTGEPSKLDDYQEQVGDQEILDKLNNL